MYNYIIYHYLAKQQNLLVLTIICIFIHTYFHFQIFIHISTIYNANNEIISLLTELLHTINWPILYTLYICMYTRLYACMSVSLFNI